MIDAEYFQPRKDIYKEKSAKLIHNRPKIRLLARFWRKLYNDCINLLQLCKIKIIINLKEKFRQIGKIKRHLPAVLCIAMQTGIKT